MQELESSQRQIEEQHRHKVPRCRPTLPAWEGAGLREEGTHVCFKQLL